MKKGFLFKLACLAVIVIFIVSALNYVLFVREISLDEIDVNSQVMMISGCSFDTPICVLHYDPRGFGNMIAWATACYMRAKREGLVLVWDQKQGGGTWGWLKFWRDYSVVWEWLVPTRAFFRPTTCQRMFEESPGMFTNVRYWNLDYGIDAGLFAVPRLIVGAVSPKNSMTLLSWYRQNFMEYFMPSSLNMSELQSRFSLIRRQLDAKPEMVNFGNSDNLDTLVNELLPLRSMYSKETFFIGVHIRRGDSCTTRVINTGRPPCQEVSVYANAVKQIISSYRTQQNIHEFVILVASDSERATKELQDACSGDVPLTFLKTKINRNIYVPRKVGEKIEQVARTKSFQLEMYYDFLADLLLMMQSNAIVGQFFSTYTNLMLILAQPKTGYVAIDRAVPCMRGGCPNPLGNAGLLGLGFNRRHHLSVLRIQNGPKFLVEFAQAYKTYNLNFADHLPSFHDGYCIASNMTDCLF